MPEPFLHFVCYKWGNLYDSQDVNILFAMVRRNTTIPHDFCCITDDPTGLSPEINVSELPVRDLPGNSPKLLTFSEDFLGHEKGSLVVSLDIDIVIVDNIDFLADNPELDFVIAKHRAKRATVAGHGAVYRVRVGSHPEVWTDFVNASGEVRSKFPGLNGNAFSEQDWLESKMGPAQIDHFPVEKIILFRSDCRARAGSHVLGRGAARLGLTTAMFGEARLPAKGEAIVSFAGKTKPKDVKDRHFGHLRRAPFVAEHWRL